MNLRDVREAAALTQHELGILSGLGQSGIARVESGNRKLSPGAKIRVVRALKLTAEQARSIPELAVEPVTADQVASMQRHPSREPEIELDPWQQQVGTR